MRYLGQPRVRSMTAKKRVGILISGRGSNMMALVEAARAADYPAEIAAIISSRPDAPGLAWAKAQGLPAQAIDHKAFPSREAFDEAVHQALTEAGIELVALAGFMRIQSAGFVARWQGRQLNIHPSLLPLFKGLDPAQAGAGRGREDLRLHGALRDRGDGQRPDRGPGGRAGGRWRHP